MHTIRIDRLNSEPYNWETNKVSMIPTFARLPRHTDANNKTYLNLSDFPDRAEDALYALYHKEEFSDPLLSEVAYVNVDLSIAITKNEDLDLISKDWMKLNVIEASSAIIKYAMENGYSHIFQGLEQINLSDRLSKQDTLELAQFLKSHNCAIKKMKVNWGKEVDVIILDAIEPDIHIISDDQTDQRKTKLFKEFYSKILESNSVEVGLESALQVALSTDDKPYTPGHALRILQKFDWKFLEREEVLEEISHLRAQYQVEPDTYHYESASDLHFYMTKVIDDNFDSWKSYAIEEERLKDNFRWNRSSFDKAKFEANVGICAFHETLEHYDDFETEAWVVYAANKVIANPSKPEFGAIEMFVTSATSEHSVFMTNSGIARAPSYNGENHAKLSMQLHGFAAKIMLQMHENLAYMINSPVNTMLRIAVNSFKDKFGDSSSIYISNSHKEPINEELEKLKKWCKIQEKEGRDKSNRTSGDYFDLYKRMILREQLDLKIEPPLRITGDSENAAEDLSFQLFDKNQEQLCELTPNDQHGEYAWFFENIYASDGLKYYSSGILATFDIGALSEFVEVSGEVEHL